MSWEPLPDPDRSLRGLDQSLGRLQRTMGLARPDVVVSLERHWSAIVGPSLAGLCAVDSVRHEELVVVASDPAVAEHLKWSSNELVGAVNAVCGGEVIRTLSVRLRAAPG